MRSYCLIIYNIKITILFLLIGLTLFINLGCSNRNIENCIHSVFEITLYHDDEIYNQGTGFCIGKDNQIMSVAHLFDNYNSQTDKIVATNLNNDEYVLNLINYNRTTDVAVLLIEDYENVKINSLRLATQQPNNLDNITMIGNSRGYGLSYSKGIVSMTKKVLSANGILKNVMQTNITINSGDSGAPIFNDKCEVVGMMSFKLSDGNGHQIDGISFSVLIEDMLKMLNT